MALKTKLDKVSYESLSDELKKEYIPDGDGYKLDADYEDVTGLKAKRDELLKELTDAKKQMKAFDGLDAEAARKALETAMAAEDEKLKAAGEFERLQALKDERHKADLEKATAETQKILANLKREKLANALTEKGVLPDRVKYLIGELDGQLELASTDNGFSLKKIGGIGDAAEFDGIIESVKTNSPFFFAADGASGSGASGSDGSGSTTAQQWTRQQWDGASTKDRTAFTEAGGKIATT